MSKFYVYMIECRDGSIYTGQTNNIERRINEHKLGKSASAKYIRTKGFFKVLLTIPFETRSHAMLMEKKIKTFSKDRKLQFIQEFLSQKL